MGKYENGTMTKFCVLSSTGLHGTVVSLLKSQVNGCQLEIPTCYSMEFCLGVLVSCFRSKAPACWN